MDEHDEGTFRIFDVLARIDRYRLVIAATSDEMPAEALVAAKLLEKQSLDLVERLKRRVKLAKQKAKKKS